MSKIVLPKRGTLDHQGRVELYVRIINERAPKPLTDFLVAAMRNNAPSQEELNALNEALAQIGWQR